MGQALSVQLIGQAEPTVVFPRYCFLDVLTWHLNPEVQIAKVDLHIVVTDLVVAVLSGSLTFICFLTHIGELVLSILNVLFIRSSS